MNRASLRVAVTSSFLTALTSLAAEPLSLTPTQKSYFETSVRPILVTHCYKCHSLEHGKAKGGLTLDTREGWQKGGSEGPVIIPGDPEKSLLVKAIRYTDPDLQMPPKGEKLTDKQIADLTFWVKMGAPDPRTAPADFEKKISTLNKNPKKHWAYQPVTKPTVPEVDQKRWVATPVDAFVLAKLEQNKMKPTSPAAREALLRRAYYDLIGLPPSPAEVQEFLFDKSPMAFARVVDRLLASPHYGERWGRYWLDTARYSDTKGGDNNRNADDYRYAYAWTYRDYVIKAFNEDKPYNKFIVEQLAADKLPDIDQDKTRLAALGFITVGERFNNQNDTINDRIDVVSKGFLGSTVTCARCHDHKFDPIPTADYYSLHGVFTSSIEPDEKPLIQPIRNNADYKDYLDKRRALEQQNRDAYYKSVDRVNSEFRQKAAPYLMAMLAARKGNDAEQIKKQNEYIQRNKLDRDQVREVARSMRKRDDPVFRPLLAFAQLSESEFPAKANELAAKFATDKKVNPRIAQALHNANLRSMDDVAAIYGRVFASVDAEGRAFVATYSKVTTVLPSFDPNFTQLVQIPYEVELNHTLDTDKLRRTVRNWPRRGFQNMGFTFAQLNELELTHPSAPARAMVLNDAPKPQNSAIFIRGEAQTKGPVVPRQFLEILSAPDRKPFADGSGRLELGHAIASKDNPITARVMVNRIWMHHFGDGFVPTPDDLGTQSEPPSHPELLDYLAATFMENGWSIKQMHRLIMLSNVYQQSSDTRADYEQLDPQNRLLWRANIRRLDFEAQRDSLLVFSGKLDRTLGGKPVNITDEPYTYRRSVYGYIDRGNLPELMNNFDFSDPDMPNSKRATTVVPQQALFFMNSPMVVDVARKVVARSEVARASSEVGRIWAIYQIIYQRLPRPEELKLAQTFLGLEKNANVPIESPAVAAAEENATVKEVSSVANKKMMRSPAEKKEMRKDMQAMRQGRAPIANTGETVARLPLSVWEEFVQALLLANESAYVN